MAIKNLSGIKIEKALFMSTMKRQGGFMVIMKLLMGVLSSLLLGLKPN